MINLFSRRHAIKDGVDVRIDMNGYKVFDLNGDLLDTCITYGDFDCQESKPLKSCAYSEQGGSINSAQVLESLPGMLGHFPLEDLKEIRNKNSLKVQHRLTFHLDMRRGLRQIEGLRMKRTL